MRNHLRFGLTYRGNVVNEAKGVSKIPRDRMYIGKRRGPETDPKKF